MVLQSSCVVSRFCEPCPRMPASPRAHSRVLIIFFMMPTLGGVLWRHTADLMGTSLMANDGELL